MLKAVNKGCSIAALPIYICVQVCFIPQAYSSPVSVPYIQPAESIEASFLKLTNLPLSIGNMDWKVTESDDRYILTRTQDPDFVQITERLPAGGFGRILRYRGWTPEGQWVDLEFIYQDQANSILILDYKAGRFFRTTFKGKRDNPDRFFPVTEEISVGDLMALQSSPFKLIGSSGVRVQKIIPEIECLRTQYSALSEFDVWFRKKVRGPPAGGAAS